MSVTDKVKPMNSALPCRPRMASHDSMLIIGRKTKISISANKEAKL